MSRTRFLARRLVWTVLATYLVLSATFALEAFTPDPNASLVAFQAAQAGEDPGEAYRTYRATRNRDEPLVDRYLTFLARLSTLQLGASYETGEPVRSLLAGRLLVTLQYVLPAVVVSVLVGGAVGVHAATQESSLLDHLSGATAYLLLGLPNFWVAAVVDGVATRQFGSSLAYRSAAGPWAWGNLLSLTLPAVVLTSTLLAAQLRYARSETRDELQATFVTVARAKGATRLRVARHAARNALLPLLSLFFGELVAVVFVAAFVIENVIGVPGWGHLGLSAIADRDVPVVVGVALVPVVVAILGNLLQDLLAGVLDPRVGEG